MKKGAIIPFTLIALGLILLVGGVSAYLLKASSTITCEACGMELGINEQMPFQCHIIIDNDGATHYGCCPICTLAIAYYYGNSTVSTHCLACNQEITIEVRNGNLSSVSPSSSLVVFGAACMRNKMVCSNSCLETVRQNYEWAKDLPTLTVGEAFLRGKMMVGTKFTISPKPINVPEITYVLIVAGIIMLSFAPVIWAIMTGRIWRRKIIVP